MKPAVNSRSVAGGRGRGDTAQSSSNNKNNDNDQEEGTTLPPSSSSAAPTLLPSGKPRPKPLKHIYHDYSSIPDSEHFVRKKTGGVTMPFPEKLMNMLDRESMLHPDVISWLSHGRAFIVRTPKQFTGEIMAGYFRQSKLTSFQRQLNLYGFRRITQGADAGAYYHELFLRGRPQLCMRMQRQKVKGTGHKQPTDVTSEPNFYAMPSLSEGGGGGEQRQQQGGNGLPNLSSSQAQNGTLISSKKKSSSTPASPGSSLAMSIQAMYNSPGINAATMLQRLSASNISAPPFLSLGGGGGSGVAAASSYTMQDSTSTTGQYYNPPPASASSSNQHGFRQSSSPLGSCAKATAAANTMAAMGDTGSDGSGGESSTTSSQKMEYV
ncbi:hypothetical protein ACHAXR_009323 [Thalassiosira sp. AJA248-18]